MALRPGLSTRQTLRLGMAQLAPEGLSENWLMKHLGDLHWGLIAKGLGQERAVFHAPDGRPVYAAFCASALDLAPAPSVAAGNDLQIWSRLGRVSPSRLLSRHYLSTPNGPVGELRLISTFVAHGPDGRNGRIARSALCAPLQAPALEDDFTARAHALAKGQPDPAFGAPSGAAGPAHRFTPCPGLDFNGVGLLYFPSFAGFIDRATWAETQRAGRLLRREMVYLGNLDPGQTLAVRLTPHSAPQGSNGGLRAQSAEIHASDGRLLARGRSLAQAA